MPSHFSSFPGFPVPVGTLNDLHSGITTFFNVDTEENVDLKSVLNSIVILSWWTMIYYLISPSRDGLISLWSLSSCSKCVSDNCVAPFLPALKSSCTTSVPRLSRIACKWRISWICFTSVFLVSILSRFACFFWYFSAYRSIIKHNAISSVCWRLCPLRNDWWWPINSFQHFNLRIAVYKTTL